MLGRELRSLGYLKSLHNGELRSYPQLSKHILVELLSQNRAFWLLQICDPEASPTCTTVKSGIAYSRGWSSNPNNSGYCIITDVKEPIEGGMTIPNKGSGMTMGHLKNTPCLTLTSNAPEHRPKPKKEKTRLPPIHFCRGHVGFPTTCRFLMCRYH